MAEHAFVRLSAWYHGLGLHGVRDLADLDGAEGLVHEDDHDPEHYAVTIATGVHTGGVGVATQQLDGPPALVEPGWEAVVDVSVHVGADGPARVIAPARLPGEAEPPALSDGRTGWWRLRVHARGRNLRWDGAGPLSGEPLDELFLVQAWKASPSGGLVHATDGNAWEWSASAARRAAAAAATRTGPVSVTGTLRRVGPTAGGPGRRWAQGPRPPRA